MSTTSAGLQQLPESEWQIVIADRGFVYVGRPTREGMRILIRDCYCIRRWGTTRGLGELALHGPRDSSEIDYYGTLRLNVLAEVGGSLECNDAAWIAWHRTQSEPAAAPKAPSKKR